MADPAVRVKERADERLRSEDGEAHRGRSRRPPILGVHRVVEHLGGGGAGPSEPVEADVRQQLVDVDGVVEGHVLVGPGLELLGDPGELSDGRVGQRVANGLRAGRLELQVARVIL
jgi:hypothetical protein